MKGSPHAIRSTLRLALAAALFALSASVARAEKVSLVCAPENGSAASVFNFEIDYGRSAAILAGGTAFPAHVTDNEVTWTVRGADTPPVVSNYKLNRITGILTIIASFGNNVRADDFRCSRGKQQF
jgi:hypothetical protein